MSTDKRLCVKLLHNGNVNITNPEDKAQKNIFYMPMGVFALAARLKKEKFDVEIIHLDLEAEHQLEDILDGGNVDAVGFDCHWVNQSLGVIETAEAVKKINPDIFVFLGGFSASFFAEEIVRDYPQVDAVIRGDAEYPIVELCRSLEAGSDSLEGVPNLVWRNSGAVQMNPFTYVGTAEDMDQLDFAAIDLLRNWKNYRMLCEFWTRFSPLNHLSLFLLSVGRGCVYSCSFCGGNARAQSMISNRKGQIVRSVDSTIGTIKKAISFGYSLIYTCYEFEDSDQWYLPLFKRIKEEKLEISWGYGCYSLPSRELLDALSDTFQHVMLEISPETADLELRKKNKDLRIFYTNQELEDCLEYIGTKGNIKVQAFFAYFLPFDSEDSIRSTLRLISRLHYRFSDWTELIYGNLSTDPASLLYFDPDSYDVDISIRNFGDYLAFLRKTYVQGGDKSAPDMTAFMPRGMEQRQFLEWAAKIRIFDYLFNFFGPSLKLLFDRAEETDIVVEYLDQMEIVTVTEEDLSIEKMKDLFLEICQEYVMLDSELINSVNKDLEAAPALDIRLKANL